MDGFIKIYRKICDNPLWLLKPFSKGQAWVDLIILATYQELHFEKRGVKIQLDRGQLAWSEKALADRWGWSRKKIDTFLNGLKKEHQIELQKNNITTIINIVNYDLYQNQEPQKEPQKNTKRTAKEPQKNTYNKDKNVKKEKNNIILPFESETFKKAWDEWIEYHQQRSKKMYVPIGEQKVLSHLYKISNQNEKRAIELIEYAMAHNWEGFFIPREDLFSQNGQAKVDPAKRLPAGL